MRLGKPEQPERFYKLQINGLTVYFDPKLAVEQPITIGLKDYWLFKALEPIDWKLF